MKIFLCLALFVAAASATLVAPYASPLAYSASPFASYAAAPIAYKAAFAAPVAASYVAPVAYRTSYSAPIVASYASPIAYKSAYSSIAAPLAYNGYGSGIYGTAYPGYAGSYAGFLKKKK